MSALSQTAPSRAYQNPHSSAYRSPFLAEVAVWLARTRIAPSRLGYEALGDYNFVDDLRTAATPAPAPLSTYAQLWLVWRARHDRRGP